MELLFQNILQTLRSLRTQTWQVVVSALGLAVSIVCLSFSVNWLWSETNYDAFRPDYKDLYVLQRADSLGIAQTDVYPIGIVDHVAAALRPRGDSVGMACTIEFWTKSRVTFARTDSSEQPRYYKHTSMDAAMLRTLGVEVLAGEINDSPSNRDEQIIITDRMAMQLFGRTDVVGEVLYNTDGNVRYKQKRYSVGAVIKANASKSFFSYDCISYLYASDYEKQYKYNTHKYQIVIRSKDIDATMHALQGLKRDDGKPLYFASTPLRLYPRMSIMENSSAMQGKGGFLGVYFYQLAFVVVSLLLLLSALANLIAVNTSICLSRTREYALRRSLGGSTWQNAQWLLTGIVPTLLLGMTIAAVAWEWMLKMQWVEIDKYRAMPIFWLMVLAAMVCCFLGMLYPIIKMHRIYKRSFAGSGAMGRSHGWLVAVQCVVCAFLLFLSWGMSRQLNDMMNEDVGLDTHNLLRLHTGHVRPKELDNLYDFSGIYYDLPQEFKKHGSAGIVDAVSVPTDIFNRTTFHSVLVGSLKLRDEYTKDNHDQWVEQHKDELIVADYVEMEYSVQKFFKPRTAEGRQMDDRVSEKESFAQVYGDKQFMERVGRDVTKREPLYIIAGHKSGRGYGIRILGEESHWVGQELHIVDEVNLNATDFHQQRIPTIYVGVPDKHWCSYIERDAIYIRYAEGRLADAEAAVRKVLTDMDVPENEYLLTTFEEYMGRSYKEDMFYARLVSWLTVFSFLITLVGVFSTLLYTLRLQRRNMAIRRVMGAEFGDVFYGTLRPYVIYAVLGAVVAFAPAMLLMNKWMSYFSYGDAPGIGLMLSILLMMLTVITLIVLWQVNKIMNEKPIDVLRPEA